MIRVVVVVGLVVAIAIGVFVALSYVPTDGQDVITYPALEYSTPPTNFGPFTATNGAYGDGAATTLRVSPGSEFNLSFQFGCEQYNVSGSARYVITKAMLDGGATGFGLVSTNCPVTFGIVGAIGEPDQWGTVNVTLRSPSWPGFYSPTVWITGGPA